MDIDSDFHKMNIKPQEEGDTRIPMDSEGSSNVQNDKGKENEELTNSMKKLQVEESSSGQAGSSFKKKPVIIIVVGMAGSGKTTFLHRLVSHTRESNVRGYVMNLDPAVMTLPFGANIDIRDTVRYKEVMKQFNLGPNGGILTSLNLFATKFDEVVSVIEKRADQLDYVLVDTPGQIEIFTWSASGAIITEAFASTFPTVIAYVVDTPRSASPVTFMSNMLYACSILYKTRLPLVLAFNKTDVAQHQFALEWMEDFEAFQAAVSTDTLCVLRLERMHVPSTKLVPIEEDMESSSKLPLHICHVHKLSIVINRTHIFFHSIALVFLLYYRASFFFFQDPTKTKATTVAWLLVFVSEILLSFEWLLGQSSRWRRVSRTAFPERLPADDKLPAVDVFICTADPEKEPTVGVMNTVLSAMAMNYPPEKLHVYLSDDGGAAVTLKGMREAWRFAKWWLPFCRRYGIKCRAPEAYFSAEEEDADFGGSEFIQDREDIKEKYEAFKKKVKATVGDTRSGPSRDHPAVIEVIQETSSDDAIQENETKNIPLLVYVSREKRPSHFHNFKAGALNVLLRVSGVISNSPYILGLDCDMHCHDPSSARQAMCFHLDPKISPSLAFVQFPQKFHNISNNDIYDSQMRSIFWLLWQGVDGVGGPGVAGTGYYIKRLSLCSSSKHEDGDPMKLRQSFGPSNEFIKSLHQNNKPDMLIHRKNALLNEAQLLASCAFENGTEWGEEVGFMYGSVAEDYVTGFRLHCKGWISVYCNPPRPQFLGRGITNLDDFFVHVTRWTSGMVDVLFSKFCPLIYGPFKTSTFLHSMCYAEMALIPIVHFLPLWCLATIPQLCLLNGIPLYPEVSNSYFIVFSFVFLSLISKHLYEVLSTGFTFRHWINEQRVWMMKSVISDLYGSVDGFMKKIGMREASFYLTNKVDDVDQLKRYNMGVFDFQTSILFLAPMAALVILNMASFAVGIYRVILLGELDKFCIQVFIPFYVILMNYPIVEGMLIRKDGGRIPPSVTLLSAIVSLIFYFLGYIIFM